MLPDSFTAAGVLTLTLNSVQKADSGTALVVERATPLSVRFQVGSPMRICILGMRYSMGNPPRSFVPSDKDFNMLVSWLRRAYPVTQVISTRAIIDATAAPPFDGAATNAQLAAIRGLDVSGGTDRRTHYYGMVSDGGFFQRGLASGIPPMADRAPLLPVRLEAQTGAGTLMGVTVIGMVARSLGTHSARFHPGFCGESADDPSYPYANGQLANTDGSFFVGFDVGDSSLNLPMVALPGTTWHDVMTYCDAQWLSNTRTRVFGYA